MPDDVTDRDFDLYTRLGVHGVDAVLVGPGDDCPNCGEGHSRVLQPVQGNVWTDTHQRETRVTVSEKTYLGFLFTFAPQTYQVLAFHEMLADVLDHVEPLGAGEYLLPRSVLEREQAEDVERHLDYLIDLGMTPEEDKGGQCTLPTCIQDGVDRKRGFLLCRAHSDLMQGWDDLIEVG